MAGPQGRVALPGQPKEVTMTQPFNRTSQPGSSANDIVASVLSMSVLVLAGIISIAQFAYY